jgi:hypothetical protein
VSEWEFKVGEQIVISCEPVDTEVLKKLGDHYCVKWPWGAVDQQSRFRWDGSMAFPVDDESFEWQNTPWRLEPDPSELVVGASCMVGIPPTRVVVQDVENFDPPRDLGWLPRPTLGLAVVSAGQYQDHPDAGYMLYLDGPEPIEVRH